MLVVWEPILATDWRSPSRSILARIPDTRAKQFWDPKHLVAQELGRIAKGKPEKPKPDCCVNKGFFWDEVILYTPHSRWKEAPTSIYLNGPVVRVMPGLEEALHGLK